MLPTTPPALKHILRNFSNGEDWWHPHRILVELVEGCKLRCHSCGVAGIRESWDDSTRLMDRYLPLRIAAQLRKNLWWHTPIIFTGRGEPAMHPNLDWIIEKIARKRWGAPMILETSGAGLLDTRLRNLTPIGIRMVNRLSSLMGSGLSGVVLHRRAGTAHLWDALDAMAEDACMLLESRLVRYKWKKYHGRNQRVLQLVTDVVRAPMADQPASCHLGAGARPYRTRRSDFCERPARELVVRFDGRVVLCQEDYRGELCIGDINTQTIREMWFGPAMREMRARTLNSQRIGPCQRCDYFGRISTVQRGPEFFPQPTAEGLEAVRKLLEQPLLTTPVLRPWER